MTDVIVHLSKSVELTQNTKGEPNVNYGLWVTWWVNVDSSVAASVSSGGDIGGA